MALLAGLAALLAPRPVAGSLDDPPSVEYLYIEANAGSASGGHAAIRFGDVTYHFQHRAPGVLRLQRDDSQALLHRYAMLENRTIHVSRIATSTEVYTHLRRAFLRRYLIQSRHFEVLDGLRGDRALFTTLLALRRGSSALLALPAAGFFFADSSSSAADNDVEPADNAADRAAPLLALRERVSETYGRDFLRDRSQDLRRQLGAMRPDDADVPELEGAVGQYPHISRSFSERYQNRMVGLMALRSLDAARGLQPGTYAVPAGDEFRLSAAQRVSLGHFAHQLAGQLVRLLQSSRPDWGFALLVGMARLVAIDQAQQLGSLVVLDACPSNHQVLSRPSVARYAGSLSDQVAAARRDLQEAETRVFAAEELGEEGWGNWEGAASRFLERQGAAAGRPMRVCAGPLLSHPALRSDIVLPQMTEEELVSALTHARARERSYAGRLLERYGYNLITRNCVSEIFRTLNAALATLPGPGDTAPERSQHAARVRAASRAHLGGYIDTDWSLNFIPFVSAEAVQRRYAVAATHEIVSYRRARLAEMYRSENAVVAYARESNVFTSRLYRPKLEDSAFLFFTDDAVALRPVFGAFNLMAGLATGTAGLLLSPVDRGATLAAGARGVLFSLPELMFCNIRKGSFDIVEDPLLAPSR